MIAASDFWLTVVCLGLGTIAIRLSFIIASSKFSISPRLREIFSFIPAAILPALIGPAVFLHRGTVGIVMGKERAVILLAAGLVCFLSRSMVATIIFGLAALYLVNQY